MKIAYPPPPREPMTPDEFEKRVAEVASNYRWLFENERPTKPTMHEKTQTLSDYEMRARVHAIATQRLAQAVEDLRAQGT